MQSGGGLTGPYQCACTLSTRFLKGTPDSDDPVALAEALVEITNKPPAAARLAEGRREAIEKYDEAKAREKLLALYESFHDHQETGS